MWTVVSTDSSTCLVQS